MRTHVVSTCTFVISQVLALISKGKRKREMRKVAIENQDSERERETLFCIAALKPCTFMHGILHTRIPKGLCQERKGGARGL